VNTVFFILQFTYPFQIKKQLPIKATTQERYISTPWYVSILCETLSMRIQNSSIALRTQRATALRILTAPPDHFFAFKRPRQLPLSTHPALADVQE